MAGEFQDRRKEEERSREKNADSDPCLDCSEKKGAVRFERRREIQKQKRHRT